MKLVVKYLFYTMIHGRKSIKLYQIVFIPCQFVVHYMNRIPRTCETAWIRTTRLSQLHYGQQLCVFNGLLRWLCVPVFSLEP
jgi:hypothetical protein